jgi:lycopene cyclase domain-containing protein
LRNVEGKDAPFTTVHAVTYSQFHFRFNVPLLAFAGAISFLAPWRASVWAAFLVILGIVVVFTTPWDNYAVSQGIWSFPGGRHAFRIWHLPIEEYCFFVIQSIEVLLICHGLTGLAGFQKPSTPPLNSPGVVTGLGAIAALWVFTGLWFGRRLPRRAQYLFHLLYWFGPVAAFQWVLAAPLLLANLSAIILATMMVSIWLTLADLAAVRQGIWEFDEKQILGLKWRSRLPIEEILFFFVSSLLVAQSYVMLAPAAARILAAP